MIQGCQFCSVPFKMTGISLSNLKKKQIGTNFILLRILARSINSAKILARMFRFHFGQIMFFFLKKYYLVLRYQSYLSIRLVDQTEIL
jgi:hypothetical protein